MKNNSLHRALIAALLFAPAGCLSIAPIEPVKNPPTKFRSDNVVAVEFLSPARVGLRCGERGTQAFGIPVFHAMACGNDKLITMPDPCLTFTGGDYASLLCDQRNHPPVEARPQALGSDTSFQVEFVHPSAVLQRCSTRGLDLTYSEQSVLASCASANLMTVPNPCMILEAGWYPRTLCHELAHANGWPMYHPGGSFLSDARAGVDKNDVPLPRAVLASLSAAAPLRPASESPAYLALVATKTPTGASPAQVTRPAVAAQLPGIAENLRQPVTVLPAQSAPDLPLSNVGDAAANRFNASTKSAPELMTAAIFSTALALRARVLIVAGTIHLAGAHTSGSRPLTATDQQPAPAVAHPQGPAWFVASARELVTGSVEWAARRLVAAMPDDPAALETINARLAAADSAKSHDAEPSVAPRD